MSGVPQPIGEKPLKQNPPEVDTTLSLSASTCSLSGNPPFTISISHEYIGEATIWALISLHTPWAYRIECRDPLWKNRKVTPVPSWIDDEWDEHKRDLRDSALVRLQRGEKFTRSYTLDTTPKWGGVRPSDMRQQTLGKRYNVTLRERKWRWIFEKDMPDFFHVLTKSNEREDIAREILSQRDAVMWEVGCADQYEAVP